MDEKLNEKGLFTFTGNPIIDNGMAVLANIAKKENFEEIIIQVDNTCQKKNEFRI